MIDRHVHSNPRTSSNLLGIRTIERRRSPFEFQQSIMFFQCSINVSLSILSFVRAMLRIELTSMNDVTPDASFSIEGLHMRGILVGFIVVFCCLLNYLLLSERLGALVACLLSIIIWLVIDLSTWKMINILFKTQLQRKKFSKRAMKSFDAFIFIVMCLPTISYFVSK